MPDKTAETIDEDGYLHSGDVAEFDNCDRPDVVKPSGFMKVHQNEHSTLNALALTSPRMYISAYTQPKFSIANLVYICVVDPYRSRDVSKN